MQKSTIELKHRDKINSYNQDYLNNEKNKQDLKNIEELIPNETNLQKILSLNNDLNDLKAKIQKNESRENEIEYLLNVVPILNLNDSVLSMLLCVIGSAKEKFNGPIGVKKSTAIPTEDLI